MRTVYINHGFDTNFQVMFFNFLDKKAFGQESQHRKYSIYIMANKATRSVHLVHMYHWTHILADVLSPLC